MKKFSILFCCFCISTLFVRAQDNPAEGKVEIIADGRLDRLTRLKRDQFLNDSGSSGFRIQIYSTNERKAYMQEEDRFKAMFPDVPFYLEYSPPNYKLRVGDYKNRLEAQYLFFKLSDEFPHLFLVPDKINPPQYRRIFF
jgi:hypothetical protein